MNLTLTRTEINPYGIFGVLTDENNNQIAVTLEHAYPDNTLAENVNLSPKIPTGVYTCQRGQHRLHSGPIETFEVLNVPGHSGILLHYGNTNADSDGCILVGETKQNNMILSSRVAFSKFMDLQVGLDQFQLTIC